MYLLKVRQKEKIIFEKEYDNFEDLMKKFESIDFESGKYSYSIYKNQSIKDILKLFFEELKKVIND